MILHSHVKHFVIASCLLFFLKTILLIKIIQSNSILLSVFSYCLKKEAKKSSVKTNLNTTLKCQSSALEMSRAY